MTYIVNDVFYTLQGEGFWTGRAAVFCRFARCNLWTGREQDRSTAVCTFCDTDFLSGTRTTLDELLQQIDELPSMSEPMIVLTGGEPLLQVNQPLLTGLHDRGFYVAVETNGTRPIPRGIDWVCVSPKPARLVAQFADELKLVYPQPEVQPNQFGTFAADHFWLSPMDGPRLKENTQAAAEYCLAHPQWRLNVQTHKVAGLK